VTISEIGSDQHARPKLPMGAFTPRAPDPGPVAAGRAAGRTRPNAMAVAEGIKIIAPEQPPKYTRHPWSALIRLARRPSAKSSNHRDWVRRSAHSQRLMTIVVGDQARDSAIATASRISRCKSSTAIGSHTLKGASSRSSWRGSVTRDRAISSFPLLATPEPVYAAA